MKTSYMIGFILLLGFTLSQKSSAEAKKAEDDKRQKESDKTEDAITSVVVPIVKAVIAPDSTDDDNIKFKEEKNKETSKIKPVVKGKAKAKPVVSTSPTKVDISSDPTDLEKGLMEQVVTTQKRIESLKITVENLRKQETKAFDDIADAHRLVDADTLERDEIEGKKIALGFFADSAEMKSLNDRIVTLNNRIAANNSSILSNQAILVSTKADLKEKLRVLSVEQGSYEGYMTELLNLKREREAKK